MKLSKKVTCGHCNNIAPMQICGEAKVPETWGEPEDGSTLDVINTYFILKCPACAKINFFTSFWSENMGDGDISDFSLLYPKNSKMPEGLPSKIKSGYLAAEKVKNIDVNAYAILMRRLLEMVCLEKGAKQNSLGLMLKDLSKKNEIPEKLVDVANGLKSFGNIGAHAGSGELSKNEIPILQALTAAILEYLFSAPHLADIAEKKLKTIKVRNNKKKNVE